MTEVKRYHVVSGRLCEGVPLGMLGVVLVADFDRVTAERDALQQRLTAANERVDVLEALLRESLPALDLAAGAFKSVKTIRNKVRAALKPAEARARIQRHECSSCKGQGLRVMGGEMTECPSCDGEGFKP